MRIRLWITAAGLAAAVVASRPLAQLPQGSEPPWPHIFGISPSSGPPGTRVVIKGAYFRPEVTVLIGGVEAFVESEDEAEIVVVVPPHAPGRVSVQVRNYDNRSAVRGWGFRYLPVEEEPAPEDESG
jgi:hypothetical protein